MSDTKGKKKWQESEEEGTFWRSTLIELPTRLRAARGIGKNETESSAQAFAMLKSRGNPKKPPPLVSDGWGGITEGILEVYGEVPAYKGRGRRPIKKRAGQGWQYLQMVKIRENGMVIAAKPKVIFGGKAEVLANLEPHTAYVERTHLTSRLMNARLIRKGLGFSKKLEAFRESCVLEDVVYNFCRYHKSLRQEVEQTTKRWNKRTPAMAAGITEKKWSLEQLFSLVPIPVNFS